MQALNEPDPLTVPLRGKIREFIETLATTELTEALAAVRYARGPSRQGYRHGWSERTLTTGMGPPAVTLPRARLPGRGQARLIQGPETTEWRSALSPKYERRAAALDAAILGSSCAGANSRRIKGTLAPPLRGAPPSKSASARVGSQANT